MKDGEKESQKPVEEICSRCNGSGYDDGMGQYMRPIKCWKCNGTGKQHPFKKD